MCIRPETDICGVGGGPATGCEETRRRCLRLLAGSATEAEMRQRPCTILADAGMRPGDKASFVPRLATDFLGVGGAPDAELRGAVTMLSEYLEAAAEGCGDAAAAW